MFEVWLLFLGVKSTLPKESRKENIVDVETVKATMRRIWATKTLMEGILGPYTPNYYKLYLIYIYMYTYCIHLYIYILIHILNFDKICKSNVESRIWSSLIGQAVVGEDRIELLPFLESLRSNGMEDDGGIFWEHFLPPGIATVFSLACSFGRMGLWDPFLEKVKFRATALRYTTGLTSMSSPRLMCEISECGVRAHEGATEAWSEHLPKSMEWFQGTSMNQLKLFELCVLTEVVGTAPEVLRQDGRKLVLQHRKAVGGPSCRFQHQNDGGTFGNTIPNAAFKVSLERAGVTAFDNHWHPFGWWAQLRWSKAPIKLTDELYTDSKYIQIFDKPFSPFSDDPTAEVGGKIWVFDGTPPEEARWRKLLVQK